MLGIVPSIAPHLDALFLDPGVRLGRSVSPGGPGQLRAKACLAVGKCGDSSLKLHTQRLCYDCWAMRWVPGNPKGLSIEWSSMLLERLILPD